MTGTTCDTSVLVPALLDRHPDHHAARRVLEDHLTATVAHVLLESFSVLTRLPAPLRISARTAAEAVSGVAVRTVTLPPEEQRALLTSLAGASVRGGAVYDGLVAATARHHDLRLLTRDRRARATYDAVGVDYAVV